MHPLIHGGAQERNRRGGTENVAGIVALAKAYELAQGSLAAESRRIGGLRDRLEQGIMARVPDVLINGDRKRRLPNTVNISFAGVDADSLLANLDLGGLRYLPERPAHPVSCARPMSFPPWESSLRWPKVRSVFPWDGKQRGGCGEPACTAAGDRGKVRAS